MDRRGFLKLTAAGSTLLTGCAQLQYKASKANIVVIGGGFGGACVAKTLRWLDASLNIILIEPKARYITCPASNWLFAGLTNLSQLTVEYWALQNRHAIQLISDSVIAIDRDSRQVKLADGRAIAYDRLILSPGIAFDWNAITGYTAETAEMFPHAWQAGPQTLLLAQQLRAMRSGGVLLMVAPPEPYRCPPGPYERASMIAWWLKHHNPRAKIIILDPKRSFSKQALFEAGWRANYGYGTSNSLLEWHSLADNPVVELHADSKTVVTEFGDSFSGDVLNIIPAQTAASLALQTGLSNQQGWCDVNPGTAQSVVDERIHIIGDAAHYSPMPKSAFAANSQGKACAMAVFSLLHERPVPAPHWLNTCYSLITPQQGISVAGVYELDGASQAITAVKGAGGVSAAFTEQMAGFEAGYARSAYRNLVRNCFA